MTIFKKSCYACGAETNRLIDGKCEDCYSQDHPPIREVKPLNLKICNQCGKIHYNNALHTPSEIEKMLPSIMEKRIVIEEGYEIEGIDIKDLEFEGNKVIFDVEVDTRLI